MTTIEKNLLHIINTSRDACSTYCKKNKEDKLAQDYLAICNKQDLTPSEKTTQLIALVRAAIFGNNANYRLNLVPGFLNHATLLKNVIQPMLKNTGEILSNLFDNKNHQAIKSLRSLDSANTQYRQIMFYLDYKHIIKKVKSPNNPKVHWWQPLYFAVVEGNYGLFIEMIDSRYFCPDNDTIQLLQRLIEIDDKFYIPHLFEQAFHALKPIDKKHCREIFEQKGIRLPDIYSYSSLGINITSSILENDTQHFEDLMFDTCSTIVSKSSGVKKVYAVDTLLQIIKFAIKLRQDEVIKKLIAIIEENLENKEAKLCIPYLIDSSSLLTHALITQRYDDYSYYLDLGGNPFISLRYASALEHIVSGAGQKPLLGINKLLDRTLKHESTIVEQSVINAMGIAIDNNDTYILWKLISLIENSNLDHNQKSHIFNRVRSTHKNHSLLHFAIKHKDEELIEFCFIYDLDPWELNRGNHSPISFAIWQQDVLLFEKLHQLKPAPELSCIATAIMMAVDKNLFLIVDTLIEYRNKIDTEVEAGENLLYCFDDDRNTALHLAVKNSNIDIVQSLLAIGFDPLIKNRFGESALSLALESEDHLFKCILEQTVFANEEQLIKLKEKAETINNRHALDLISPLENAIAIFTASYDNNLAALTCLIDYADNRLLPQQARQLINSCFDQEKNTALHFAYKHANETMVDLLINYGCNMSMTNLEGKKPNQVRPTLYSPHCSFVFWSQEQMAKYEQSVNKSFSAFTNADL